MQNSKRKRTTSKEKLKEEAAFSKLTGKILQDIACGKIKTRKFNLSELD
ncbi:hypothetical protein J4441_05900 [Candidatus Micrarchaeota archaeon]|nr:hypothetical protein [Candidatus Micrarchaeota archaeon]